MTEVDRYHWDDWDPDKMISILTMERHIHSGESPEATAERIFRENAPAAAQSIVHLALRDSNSRVRLQASQYLIERVMGRVAPAVVETTPVSAMWDDLYEQIMMDPDAVEKLQAQQAQHAQAKAAAQSQEAK